jgi:hypothetical protein
MRAESLIHLILISATTCYVNYILRIKKLLNVQLFLSSSAFFCLIPDILISTFCFNTLNL